MKKAFVIVLVFLMSFMMVSCAKWEQIKKNWSSNASGGLNRYVRVTNMVTGDLVWENTGKSYIDGNSEPGDVAVIFYDEAGNSKKADFIGNFYGVESIEL